MFLLISASEQYLTQSFYFNTSHVSINQFTCCICCGCWYISIHLMFLLIYVRCIWKKRKKQISIHLMFLLIGKCKIMGMRHLYFNTSHVSINPTVTRCRTDKPVISIHLMFLLIHAPYGQVGRHGGISIHLMFLLIRRAWKNFWQREDFNTSHVSINLTSWFMKRFMIGISIHLMFLLILGTTKCATLWYWNFNTSHVSINPEDILVNALHLDFNTSHVSINQR